MFFLGRYAPGGGTLCAVVGETALGHTFFQITVPSKLLAVVTTYSLMTKTLNCFRLISEILNEIRL